MKIIKKNEHINPTKTATPATNRPNPPFITAHPTSSVVFFDSFGFIKLNVTLLLYKLFGRVRQVCQLRGDINGC